MNIIFFGTSDFAVACLNKLILARRSITAVVTAPDQRKGRGRRMAFSAVKSFAQEKRIPLLQPQKLRGAEFLQSLKQGPADLFVVCDYGKIFTKEMLQIPSIFAINVHASLLPKYRGAAPINWALINGEQETGISIFKMNELLDQGEIILQRKCAISSSDTALTLAEKLSTIAQEALLAALEIIEGKKLKLMAQDERQASLAPRLKKEDGLVDWHQQAQEIYNRIRGLQPWPSAFTYLGNKLLKLWQAEVIRGKKEASPGEIVKVDPARGILVEAGKDKILITMLQLEGRRKMPVNEFLSGHNLTTGMKLGQIRPKLTERK